MATATHNFETATNGTAITAGNSAGAGATAFDTVSATASQTCAYSTTAASDGTRSGQFSSGATAGQSYVAWTTTIGTQSTIYGRAYLYATTATPAAFQGFFRAYSGATNRVTIGQRAAGSLQVLTAANATATNGTMTTMLPANQWVRVEWQLVLGTSGTGELRLYTDPDSTTPTETLSFSGDFGGSATDYRFGMTSTIANSTTQYLDDIGLDTTTWMGPVAAAGQTILPASDITTAGWTTTGGTGTAASALDDPTDDSDYVTSPANPSSSNFEVKFGPATDPLSSTGHSISYRLRTQNATSHSVVVGLYQGTTLIASWTETGLTSTFQTITRTLSGAQADAITDYGDLRLRVTATAS